MVKYNHEANCIIVVIFTVPISQNHFTIRYPMYLSYTEWLCQAKWLVKYLTITHFSATETRQYEEDKLMPSRYYIQLASLVSFLVSFSKLHTQRGHYHKTHYVLNHVVVTTPTWCTRPPDFNLCVRCPLYTTAYTFPNGYTIQCTGTHAWTIYMHEPYTCITSYIYQIKYHTHVVRVWYWLLV
jgi:hypothetical protein